MDERDERSDGLTEALAAYERASDAYEAALIDQVGTDERATAERDMREASNEVARALQRRAGKPGASDVRPSFDSLLRTPTEQCDVASEVLAMIIAYQQAPSATAAPAAAAQRAPLFLGAGTSRIRGLAERAATRSPASRPAQAV